MGPEAQIEKKAREWLEARGGELMKWVSPGNAGVPDRIAFHASFVSPFFMEFKAPRKTLDELQEIVCDKLAAKGARVYPNVDGVRKAIEIMDDEMQRRSRRHPIMDGFGA